MYSGHSIVVGSLGQPLTSLASFALFLAGYEVQSVDFAREGGFSDPMKSLFRQAGLEGKPIGIIIKVRQYYYSTVYSYMPLAVFST